MTRLSRDDHHVHLAGGALATARFEGSRLLLVQRGYVWITQEGRAEDFWLNAGDAIIVQPGRLVVIEAAIASEISLEQRPASGLLPWLKMRGAVVRAALQRALARLVRTGLRQGGA
jgi:uncharacterized protein (AIM24 family)